jgi:O-antigen ligase
MTSLNKPILWRISAIALGVAMPLALVSKALMALALLVGMIAGLMATHGESLRATIRLALEAKFTLLLIAFLFAAAVGVVWGINPANGADKWLQLLMVITCGGVLFITLREMPGRYVEMLFQALVYAVTGMCLVALADALSGNSYLATLLHGADKATTPYRLNFLSGMLAVLGPLVWARLLVTVREGEPRARQLAPYMALLVVIMLIVAGGRAGWVGGAVAMALFIWLASRYHGLNIHRRHYVGLVGVMALSLALYGLAFGWDFMWQRASIVGEIGVGRGMMSGRLDVWQRALEHIPDMPLFGIGLMNYRYLPDAIDLHPHNWILQMLLETGVAGTALFMVIVVLLFQTFWRFARGNIYGVAACAALAGFVVTGLANTSIFRWDWLALLVFVVAVGYRAGWSSVDQKSRRKNKLVERAALAPPRLRKDKI